MIWINAGYHDGMQASCGCDSTEDLADLPQFAEVHHLKVGSDCFCQSDYSVHFMNSDRTWT